MRRMAVLFLVVILVGYLSPYYAAIACTIGVYALCGDLAETLNSCATFTPAAFASSYPTWIALCADARSLVFTVTPWSFLPKCRR